MKRRRAVVVGLDHHARLLADLLNSASNGWRLRAYGSSRTGSLRALLALPRADALICFGGPAPNAALIIAAKRFNVPVIVIWAGSDVIKARANPFELEMIKQERFINVAVAPWLVEELDELGIQAEYQPVAGMSEGEPVRALPASFEVLTYLPEPRRDFYGAPLVYEAARAMPDVRFTVVGAGSPSANAPANVRFCGHVTEMQAVIDNSTVLLRQPEHDGMSVLVLEALSRARHVVWNYELPHVRTGRSIETVLEELRDLRSRHDEGLLELNHSGRAFVLDTFARARIASGFESRLNRAMEMRGERRGQGRRLVAMSGLGLFCAGIAEQARTSVPEWDARLMRTNSRLEFLASLTTMLSCDVWYSIGTGGSDRLLHRIARLLRKPRVIHWVGSDITALRKNPKIRAELTAPDILHLAEVGWTANQLKRLGLHARIAPLPPRYQPQQFAPLPERFTVLLYIPRTRSQYYGKRAFERLMRKLHDKPIRYLIVGGGTLDAPAGVEVENVGWRDNMRDLYAQASVLIRYTPRDGLSLMVLEALAFGRHVLWTQPFPFVHRVTRYRDIERDVRRLYEAHERGELRAQETASAFVHHQYAPDRCVRAIAQAWDDAGLPRRLATVVMETP